MKCETGPYTWRARREGREGPSTPDWCTAALISKGTYLGSLSWAATQGVVVSLQPPARILQVYVEAFTGFSPVYCPDKLTLLFQVCIFENSSTVGVEDGTYKYIPRTGKGVKNFQLPGSSLPVNQ